MKKKTNIWLFALQLGFFAGLIWGGLRGLFYYLSFTTVLPGFLMEPFYKKSFLDSQPGYYAGWFSFIVFSILATLMYVLLLRKVKGPWPGIAYGIAWWVILFALIGPVMQMTKPIHNMTVDTNISEFCIFLLWGLFVGYSTAEEFTDERGREPQKVYQ